MKGKTLHREISSKSSGDNERTSNEEIWHGNGDAFDLAARDNEIWVTQNGLRGASNHRLHLRRQFLWRKCSTRPARGLQAEHLQKIPVAVLPNTECQHSHFRFFLFTFIHNLKIHYCVFGLKMNRILSNFDTSCDVF